MNKHIVGALAIASTMAASAADMNPEKTLWYTAPAEQWEETVPVGNGRMGMMPYGNPFREHVVLNEISVWSGSRANYDNPEASKSLPEIQRLLKEGRNREAQELMYTTFVPTMSTDGGTYGSYQMLADLNVDIAYPSHNVSAYRRWLDLSEACAYTTYTIDGTDYTQECYVPRGGDVMVYRIAASRPGAVDFTATFSRPERTTASSPGRDRVMLSGMLDSGQRGVDGVRYALVAGSLALGKDARTASTDSTLSVSGADEAYIIMSAATSYLYGMRYATEAEHAVNGAIAAGDIAALKAAGNAF